ncbi:amidohydrolase family protein [Parvibaculum sp.]|uniref:amidohydrolase family protein n=1 Tax=Parvibaculum sp. TaxID=2024848 RepID=UPI00320EAE68
MRIDAHQHFWQLDKPFCTWPTPAEERIYADFGERDIAPLLDACAVDCTVLIQAAPSLEETHYLLEIADRTPFVRGVVGWIDMEASSAMSDLEVLARYPRFRGIRPMLQAIPQTEWILNPTFDGILGRLAELGLCFDALVTPRHLAVLHELAKRHPALSIIVDHAAKPAIRDGAEGFSDWQSRMTTLAANANVACKISGLLTEAGTGTDLATLRPYLDHLLSIFGAERLLWGSDWPVVLMAADYGQWVAICEAWLSDKSSADRDLFLGETARRIYRLGGAGENARCRYEGEANLHGTY